MSVHSSDFTAVDEGLTCGVCDTYAQNVSEFYKSGGYCPTHAYLTIPEVLALLRISRATYYRLVRAGKIHPRRIGLGANGRILIPRAELDSLLS